jgi:hypothetical protein
MTLTGKYQDKLMIIEAIAQGVAKLNFPTAEVSVSGEDITLTWYKEC